MDHRMLAKMLLSLLCATQGIATAAIDLNRTHATNPAWAPHARFHVVWQTVTMVFLSAMELWLIWMRAAEGFWLVAMLAVVSPIAFLVTLAMRNRFGGELSDPNGIAPARVRLGQKEMKVDMNMVAVILALVAVAGIAVVYKS